MSYIDMDNVTNSNESDIQSVNVDEVKINDDSNDINNFSQIYNKGKYLIVLIHFYKIQKYSKTGYLIG